MGSTLTLPKILIGAVQHKLGLALALTLLALALTFGIGIVDVIRQS